MMLVLVLWGQNSAVFGQNGMVKDSLKDRIEAVAKGLTPTVAVTITGTKGTITPILMVGKDMGVSNVNREMGQINWIKSENIDFGKYKLYKNGALVVEINNKEAVYFYGIEGNSSDVFVVEECDKKGNCVKMGKQIKNVVLTPTVVRPSFISSPSLVPTIVPTIVSSPTPTVVKNKLETVKDEEILSQEKEFSDNRNIFEKLLGWIIKK